MSGSGPQTLILCGGRGTRAYPHTLEVPKPLLDVAGRPVVEHVMEIYAAQGFTRFVLAAGFQAEKIEAFASTVPAEWSVQVIDTGEDTHKGDRVLKCRDVLEDTFFVTYSDGLGNVSLDRLLTFHRAHGKHATVTVVPLPSQYGTMEFDGNGRVERFREKPHLPDHWINAGFCVFDGSVFDDWPGGDLESEVMPVWAQRGELFAFRHEGFWKSMDTYKEAQDLTALASAGADQGGPPWLRSLTRASS